MGATKAGSNGGGTIESYQYQGPNSWAPYGSTIGANSGDLAGYSLALSYDGNVLAVGSVKFASNDSGLVAVHDFDGSQWNERADIPGEEKGNREGSSVALSKDGSIIVIGATGHANGSKTKAGRCKIFEWKESQYDLLHTMVGQTKFEKLGFSVSMSDDGNIIACGGVTGRWGEDTSRESGIVRLWKQSAAREKVIWPEGDSSPWIVNDGSFGSAVSFSADGKLLFVGASMWSGSDGDSPGAVHIFDTNW